MFNVIETQAAFSSEIQQQKINQLLHIRILILAREHFRALT